MKGGRILGHLNFSDPMKMDRGSKKKKKAGAAALTEALLKGVI